MSKGVSPQALIRFVYQITVNYDQATDQMINLGKYSWVDSNITDLNFPGLETGKTQTHLFLVEFDEYISSENAINEMSTQGLQPATLKELLALKINYPSLRCNKPIIALGSTWKGPNNDLHVPCLSGQSHQTNLRLYWFNSTWKPTWHLAFVDI